MIRQWISLAILCIRASQSADTSQKVYSPWSYMPWHWDLTIPVYSRLLSIKYLHMLRSHQSQLYSVQTYAYCTNTLSSLEQPMRKNSWLTSWRFSKLTKLKKLQKSDWQCNKLCQCNDQVDSLQCTQSANWYQYSKYLTAQIGQATRAIVKILKHLFFRLFQPLFQAFFSQLLFCNFWFFLVFPVLVCWLSGVIF